MRSVEIGYIVCTLSPLVLPSVNDFGEGMIHHIVEAAAINAAISLHGLILKVHGDQQFFFMVFAVESKRGDGQMTACEVMLFHHEEMGIQRDLAKMGVRQGMWGCVKKMEPGIRKYQALRKSNKPLSPSATMAQITTHVPYPLSGVATMPTSPGSSSSSSLVAAAGKEINNNEQERNRGHMKWLILGGAIALACTIDRGAVGKFLVFGVARRLGRVGRRL